MTAFDVPRYQIAGTLPTTGYDFMVNVPPGSTKAQVNLMWQNLLAERFGMLLHHEQRGFPVYEMTVRGSHKLKESTPEKLATPALKVTPVRQAVGVGVHVDATAQSPSALLALFSAQIGRPVFDRTGLTGKYDFVLQFQPIGSADPGTDLAVALQEQLGLRLIDAKATLDVIVVDKVDKLPSEN